MSLRKVRPVALADDVERADPEGDYPRFLELDPRDIHVEETYQRNLTPRMLNLIRRGAANWSWRKFTPPKIVEVDGIWVATDGQTTATMAATAGIERIPCQVITAPALEERAAAFVGQNRDKVAITPIQLHRARVAMADEDAQNVELVCKRAGVTICGFVKSTWGRGDTMAIAAIRALTNRRSAVAARQVLEVLVQADMRPITAEQIKAVDALLNAQEFKGTVKPATLIRVLRDEWTRIEADAAKFQREQRVQKWRGLVAALFQGARRAAATL